MTAEIKGHSLDTCAGSSEMSMFSAKVDFKSLKLTQAMVTIMPHTADVLFTTKPVEDNNIAQKCGLQN
jgi:hypothetical protein